MSTKLPFSDEMLAQHTGIVGKTGSGKTTTAKLIVEHVVHNSARVCILDPIKSDWWGITSSRDGRKPGLPFHIIGGPHGHVPLHAAAGAAIGSVVASGALRHSIVDMSDFDPGDHEQFFVAFAKALFKEITGVVYLVVEEAHIFAPKERGPIGDQPMSIHWMKRIATGARSKGIRMIVCTQRTQELHNSVLGSCETIVVHRLTAPADQKPVVDWLKANTNAETTAKVSGSLSSLKTGCAWVCSGEQQIVHQVHFPRISTYDNSATPDDDAAKRNVRTAPVNLEHLGVIIGEAVEQAKAKDPRELKKQVDQLRKENETLKNKPVGKVEIKTVEKSVIKPGDLKRVESAVKRIETAAKKVLDHFTKEAASFRDVLEEASKPVAEVLAKTHRVAEHHVPAVSHTEVSRPVKDTHWQEVRPKSHVDEPEYEDGPATDLPDGEDTILRILGQFKDEGADREQISVLSSYKKSTRNAYIYRLEKKGFVVDDRGKIKITQAGMDKLGPDFKPLPTGVELQKYWMKNLPDGERKILAMAVEAYPNSVARTEVDAATKFSKSTRNAYIYRLSKKYLLDIGSDGNFTASKTLF